MALQQHLSIAGLNVNDAYHRISRINIVHEKCPDHNPFGNSIEVCVEVFASHAAFLSGETPLSNKWFMKQYDTEPDADLTSLYTWLKTLPEFAGASDV